MEIHDDQSGGDIRDHGHASYIIQISQKLANIGTSSVGVEESEHQEALNFDEAVDSNRIEEVGVGMTSHINVDETTDDTEETREENESENIEKVLGGVEGGKLIWYETEKPKEDQERRRAWILEC